VEEQVETDFFEGGGGEGTDTGGGHKGMDGVEELASKLSREGGRSRRRRGRRG